MNRTMQTAAAVGVDEVPFFYGTDQPSAAAPSIRRGRPQPVVVALHGILVPGDCVNWTERFANWAQVEMPGWRVITQNYWRWPLPRWNTVPNWFRARKLARLLEPLVRHGHAIHFVGHSNGATIALATIQRLARLGLRTESALFIAGAIPADIDHSGVRRLLASERLGQTEAWWSPEDRVLGLPGFLRWPYGALGGRGFRATLRSYGKVLVTEVSAPHCRSVIHSVFGHSTYFTPAHRLETHRAIRRFLLGQEPRPREDME